MDGKVRRHFTEFYEFCGGAFWDEMLTWTGPDIAWPQFTPCFLETVLPWMPCFWLWITLPISLAWLFRRRGTAFPISTLTIAKTANALLDHPNPGNTDTTIIYSEEFFQRLWAVSKQRGDSLYQVLTHETAAVPVSLFNEDVTTGETNEDGLTKNLEVHCNEIHVLHDRRTLRISFME